jgi:sulfite reductase (ferredoxin)
MAAEDRRNRNEHIKEALDPLDLRPRIDRYAREGLASIDPDDLNIRFRWWGLYTQRPASDGHFMLRIRIPGGALSSDQLAAIGRLAQVHGRNLADVTDRQNIQLHWVVIEEVPAILDELDRIGLSSLQACGDTVRNVLGCPVAGVDAGEWFDATPDLLAVEARMARTKEFSNLPRKFKMSVSGCRHRCAQPEVNDLALVGHVHPDGREGFDLLVGGGLSSSPRFADRLGVFVPRAEAPEVVAAATAAYRDHGNRDKRTRARIKFLLAAWGPERFREVVEADYLGRKLEDGPAAPPSPDAHRDHVGVHRQRDGASYVGVAPLVGRTDGDTLVAVAALARELGSGRVRLTTQQKLAVLDVPDGRVDEAVARLDELGLPAFPSQFHRGAMACTGLTFCKLALVPTKEPAVELVRELEEAFPDFDGKIRVNVNGCPNSCARYQLSDIGLAGGESAGEGNYQLHLGGDLGEGLAFGHRVRERVPAVDTGAVVRGLVAGYLAERAAGESLQAWLRRQPPETLAALSRAPEGFGEPRGGAPVDRAGEPVGAPGAR